MTGSEAALDRFMGLHAEIADLAAELTGRVEDHFDADPDGITWAEVGDLERLAGKLRDALGVTVRA